jgi:hypothetical protein
MNPASRSGPALVAGRLVTLMPGTGAVGRGAALGLAVHGHRDQLVGVVVQPGHPRRPVTGVSRVHLGGVGLRDFSSFHHPN